VEHGADVTVNDDHTTTASSKNSHSYTITYPIEYIIKAIINRRHDKGRMQ